MPKLKLIPNPTFQTKVAIPVAGGESADVLMTFVHRTRDEIKVFRETRDAKTDEQSFMDMVTAWDLEDEFNAENVTKLLQNYAGAGVATYLRYMDELHKFKQGN